MRRALLALILLGCAPDIPSGVYVCDADADCPPAMTCQRGVCVGGDCVPFTCADRLAQCGPIDDGCGGTLDCGGCSEQQECVDNRCACAPAECDGRCGDNLPDGCGGTLDCEDCPPGETCGAGGPDICGVGTCTPMTCAEQGFQCGSGTNGCGMPLDCPDCPDNGRCVSRVCQCEPLTCADLFAECGQPDDGCGGTLDCGACPRGVMCTNLKCCPDPCGAAGDCGATVLNCLDELVICPPCGCVEDATEPANDMPPGANRGTIMIGSSASVLDHNIYHGDGTPDQDVFTWAIDDGGAEISPTVVEVVASDLGPGPHVLRVEARCSAGSSGTMCRAGNLVLGQPACAASGTGTIRVELARGCEVATVEVRLLGPAPMDACDPYTLTVSVRGSVVMPFP